MLFPEGTAKVVPQELAGEEKGLSITFPHQKDRGQREMCNCTASREIGQYELLGLNTGGVVPVGRATCLLFRSEGSEIYDIYIYNGLDLFAQGVFS